MSKKLSANHHFYLPHIAALLLFILLAVVNFIPVVEGRELVAHDTDSWRSMAQETIEYNESHDDVTLWTNSMFGGMPNYQISMKQPYNVLQYVESVILAFPRPISNLILYLIGFYILFLAMGMKPWQALIGSIGLSFASYNFIIIAAGHNSKAITIAYVAPLIGSVFLAFRKKRILGGLLVALFLSLAIRANHIQILYYVAIMLLIFGIVELVYSILENKFVSFLKTVGVMLVALIVALGMNATALITTYEYSQYTMRGKSNGLTEDTSSSQQGLNKDYITQWSYGVDETMTLLIPNFKGGASGGELSEKSETAKYLQNLGVPDRQVKEIIKQMPLYWGTQPGTSGPVYFGAIVMFLFVLSLFVVDKRLKWWLIPVIILTTMLSWGKNFMPLTDFFIDYFPMYNKFRTVSMILVVTNIAVGVMAFMALKELYEGQVDKLKFQKQILISAAITGGIALLFALIPSLAGSFVSGQDMQFQGDFAFLKDTLPLDRMAMLRADAARSLMFIVIAAFILWLYSKNYLKKGVSIALIGFFILLDLAPVAKRYLNEDNFSAPRPKQLVQKGPADEFILQDQSQFRVLDLSVNIFNDASPSFYHKNIGGYHAAKLRRYQELINMQLEREIGTLATAGSVEELIEIMEGLNILNMLNLKYIIFNKQAQPILNPYQNGNAWFVEKINIVKDANEEMRMLGEIDTKKELVVDQAVSSILPSEILPDSTASIELISYKPNHLVYNVSCNSDQVAVFSEIFYDKGWIATIDGEEVPYTRVNYLLRGMPLKAGKYELEFKFEPKSYSQGNLIAIISSIIFLLGLMAFFFVFIKGRGDKDLKLEK